MFVIKFITSSWNIGTIKNKLITNSDISRRNTTKVFDCYQKYQVLAIILVEFYSIYTYIWSV